MTTADRIYTLPQAARALRLPLRALRALIADGSLPHIVAGTDILVDLGVVEETIRAGAARKPPAPSSSTPAPAAVTDSGKRG